MISAKQIEWQHHIGKNGQQWWEDQRYGFHIDFDAGEDPAYCYAANWGAEGHDTFETLKEAQTWCQAQANRLVLDWATIDEEGEPEFGDYCHDCGEDTCCCDLGA